jgi:hypothetical protein
MVVPCTGDVTLCATVPAELFALARVVSRIDSDKGSVSEGAVPLLLVPDGVYLVAVCCIRVPRKRTLYESRSLPA